MRLAISRLVTGLVAITCTFLAGQDIAYAAPSVGTNKHEDRIKAATSRKQASSGRSQRTGARRSPPPATPSKAPDQRSKDGSAPKGSRRTQAEWEAQAKRASEHNKRVLATLNACLKNPSSTVCARRQTMVGPLNFRPDPADPAPTPVGASLPPEVVAYAAVAELVLTPPTPGIGPSPDLNPWKMAAVGYPLWLWAEGTIDPAPVSDSVYDLHVSLDAHLERVIFDMGDGNTVSCTAVTRRWTRGVEPGSESPDCGYRYAEPSLPKGDYTVTARTFWAVDWNINGVTGTIPISQTASTSLPVGELQALVR